MTLHHRDRWCRSAQPPANGFQASGLQRWLADIKSGRGLQPLRDDYKPLIDFREQRE